MDVAAVNAVFAEAFKVAAFRYSYAHTIVAEEDGQILGVCVGYPAEEEDHIDDAFAPFLPQVGITDGRELFPDHESFPGEWYLDLLAVKESAQHQGIGTQLLEAACARQQAAGQRYVGLCCDLVNPKAQALYSRLGFAEDGRVQIFAHEYRHMRKDLEAAHV
jgi:ribosomal protein S18 acetylase RimI-like enzyme